MIVEAKHEVCNGHLLKWLVGAGLAWLEHNMDQVNQMNVFPVPDGDTGTNMMLTMRKACEQISHMNEENAGLVAEAVARGALMGARGNSGVILSQLWHGFAQAVRGHELIDVPLFVAACQSAVTAGYNAVVKPVEGTLLTVSREATAAIVQRAAYERDLAALFATMVTSAKESLQRTPDLLPILKEANVVDSGGLGLVFILEGMLRLLQGETVYTDSLTTTSTNGHDWQVAIVPEDEEGYGYDVQFLMHGSDMRVEEVRAAIDAMGWSTLVVGDERMIKVHVHVHDPGQPISYAINLGAALDDVVVENMQQQYQEYVQERIARETGHTKPVEGVAVVTVASGEGLKSLFLDDLHAAYVITGGQTMNPSTADFLAAIDQLPNDEIILMPNNKNIIMAAKQAASFSHGKRVEVIGTRTIPQGISALMAYLNVAEGEDFDEIQAAMTEAANAVVSCEVTRATRSVTLEGVKVQEGQYIGLLDGQLISAGEQVTEIVRSLLERAHAADYELITFYYGQDVNQAQAEALVGGLSEDFAGQEFVIVAGGQPLYPYIISVE